MNSSSSATSWPRYPRGEILAHWVAVLAFAVVVHLLHTNWPVGYLRLISEDLLGEYATALSFLVLGAAFGVLAFRARGIRRWMWSVIAAAGLFVGMEELSWGQRLLGISLPASFKEANLQGELSLHNFVFLPQLHRIAGYLLLAWAALSAWMLRDQAAARRERTLDRIGFPLLPFPLIPWFLYACHHFIFYPMVKSDELGEFVFGLALVVFTVYSLDRFRDRTSWTASPARHRIVLSTVVLAAVLLGAQLLTTIYNGGLGYRLRTSAIRDYPHHEMYAQSDQLFEYMYENPEYLQSDTRLEHAQLLLEQGREDRAHQILQAGLAAIRARSRDPEGASRNSGPHLSAELTRIEARTLHLLGETEDAERVLAGAIALDETALADAREDREQAAALLWSLAQSEALRGDRTQALRHYRAALETSPTARQTRKIRSWGSREGLEAMPPDDRKIAR